MISDRELWACANTMLALHSERAPVFVAERIGALALAGDQAGIDTWKAIATRMDKLIHGEGTNQ